MTPKFAVQGTRWGRGRKRVKARPSTCYAQRMGLQLPVEWSQNYSSAVAQYWRTLGTQSSKQESGQADRGRRSAVTGGKQMDGFCNLFAAVAAANGMPKASVFTEASLQLPGYFRPTKKWDMVVVHKNHLVAAVEFKSHLGPSFGNNFNNRTEEALGNASDLWTAYREGAFGIERPAPWLGWVMLLEDCQQSTSPVRISEPHFKAFPEFQGTSYSDRYQLLLRRLVLEKFYSSAVLVTATTLGGPKGEFSEPAGDLTMRDMLFAFAGVIATHVAQGKQP